MTSVMSEKEARRAGLLPPKPANKSRRTAPREKGTASLCVKCGETFTTIASEDRHVTNTGHARYETVLT